MKKLIAILTIGLAAIAVQAQTINPVASPMRTLADTIQVSVTRTDSNQVWQVTVPNQVAAALAGARRTNESDIDYAKRAFFYGATGLMNEKRFYEAQAITLSNRLAQIVSSNAIVQASISNQLNAVKAKIQ